MDTHSAPAGELEIAGEIVDGYEAISLAEIGDAALLNRVDTKFLIPAHALHVILRRCREHYRVLEVGGRRLNRYHTAYFDTPGLAFYAAHHAGRAPRAKVRVRHYVETGARLLEIKRRDNKGRTIKHRMALEPEERNSLRPLADLPADVRRGLDVELAQTMETSFTRITLVRRDAAERVTLDFGLAYAAGAGRSEYPGLIFAEVKQERRGGSPFLDLMREHRIREGSISKYCLGVYSLLPAAKKNRFKATVARLMRLARGGSGDSRAA